MALGFLPLPLFGVAPAEADLAATDAPDVAAFVAFAGQGLALAATDPPDAAGFSVSTPTAAAARSLRILARITWPTAAVSRLWDGAGPFVTEDGEIWRGVTLIDGIEAIELAINGEAFTLNMSLVSVSNDLADAVWLSYTNDQIIGGEVELLIQPCGDDDQPVGDPETRFTGTVDNILFDDRVVSEDGAETERSTVTIEVTNRFTLRRLTSGSVLSDVDQRARALVLNPGGDPDRFCERVPGLADKSIVWPRFS